MFKFSQCFLVTLVQKPIDINDNEKLQWVRNECVRFVSLRFHLNGWIFSVYVIGVKSSHVHWRCLDIVSIAPTHTHTHTPTMLCFLFLLFTGVYSFYRAIERPRYALRSIVQFIYNCYCHCCRTFIFPYTMGIYIDIRQIYASGPPKTNENDGYERVCVCGRYTDNSSLYSYDLCNCLSRSHNDFSIFAFIVSISARHNYVYESGETNLICCHHTTITTNCDEQYVHVYMTAISCFTTFI